MTMLNPSIKHFHFSGRLAYMIGVGLLGVLAGLTLLINPLMTLIAIFLLIGTICIFVKPELGLHLLAILIPLQFYISSDLTIAKLVINLLLLVLIIKGMHGGDFVFINSPVNIFILLFLLARIFSLLNAPDIAHSIAEVQDMIGFILIYFVVLYTVNSKRQLKRLTITLLSVSALISLFGIYQINLGADGVTSFMSSQWGYISNGRWIYRILEHETYPWAFNRAGFVRVVGTFFNPDYYASYLGYCIPLVMGVLTFPGLKTKEKVCLWSLLALLLINLAFTFSRGGWITLVVVTTFFVMMIARKDMLISILKKSALVGAIILCLPVLLNKLNLGGQIFSRLFTVPTQIFSDPRWKVWALFLTKIKEHPFLGHGYSGFFFIPEFSSLEKAHAHSVYVQLAFIMGSIGLIIFLCFLMIYFKTVRDLYLNTEDQKMKSIVLGLLCCLVWTCFHNSIDYNFFHLKNGMMFWFYCGLAMSAHQLHHNQVRRLNHGNE